MRTTLEIVSGPYRGRKLVIGSGYAVKVGRTEWADVVLPDDRHLSGVHFAVECGQQECRIRDLKSANGTRVNGSPISETLLGDGDEIEAGQTRFIVHAEHAGSPGRSAPHEPTATHVSPRPPPKLAASRPQDAPPEVARTLKAESPRPAAPRPVASPRETARPPEHRSSPGQDAVRIVLEMTDGPSEKKKIALLAGQAVQVGRTDQADLVFPLDSQMSSIHFALAREPGLCRLRDLKSTNGTLVNGNRVTETVLADGDTIRAGQTTFVIHIEESNPLPPTAKAIPAASFRAGIEDEDPAVRREALLTAVWTRQPWLLEHCRKRADSPSPDHWDALFLLAVLGKPQDLSRILAIARAADWGPQRFELLGAYGNAATVDVLLDAMAGPDPESAVAAAVAFAKITGIEVNSEPREPSPSAKPGEPGAIDGGVSPETVRPDDQQARVRWNHIKPKLSRSTRCCRGFDLSKGASEPVLSQLDMQSRWEAICRGQYEGAWRMSLDDLEALKPRE